MGIKALSCFLYSYTRLRTSHTEQYNNGGSHMYYVFESGSIYNNIGSQSPGSANNNYSVVLSVIKVEDELG